MPRGARVVIPGLCHHITGRGNNRHDVFFTDDDRRFYLAVLGDYCRRYGLRVDAYCLMTNHVHIVGVPSEARSLELAVGRTHLRYAMYVNRCHGRSGHLWEDRFYSCPLDADHCERALRYVERNPVRAGMVWQAWQYRWSSAPAHCGDAPPHGLLGDLERWTSERLPHDWRELLRIPLSSQDVGEIREKTFTGRPLGSDAFIAKLEAQLNRRLRPNPVGRPRKTV